LVHVDVLNHDDEEYWGIGDSHDHNERREWGDEEIYHASHCTIFHALYEHMEVPMKHIGRIGSIHTDIIVRHQNSIEIDLMNKSALSVPAAGR
jgi:hypothetical protein